MFYISTKYHQTIPKGIRVTEQTQTLFKKNKKKQREITPKVRKARVVILVHDTSSHPVLHFYQVSSKYSKGYSSYRADKTFYTNADANANWIRPKNNMSPLPPHLVVVGDKIIILGYIYIMIFMQLFLKNLVNGKQHIPWSGAVWSGSTLVAYAILSENLVYQILGHLPYCLI